MQKHKKLENICHTPIYLGIGVNFCTVVVHKLAKDIIYDAELNSLKFSNLGQNNKILYKNREKLENIRHSIYI